MAEAWEQSGNGLSGLWTLGLEIIVPIQCNVALFLSKYGWFVPSVFVLVRLQFLGHLHT
jgi:hypothetical protein